MKWMAAIASLALAVSGCGSATAVPQPTRVAQAIATATPRPAPTARPLSAADLRYACLTAPATALLRAAASYLAAAPEAAAEQLTESARLNAQDAAWDALVAGFILRHIPAPADQSAPAGRMAAVALQFQRVGQSLSRDYARGTLTSARRDAAGVAGARAMLASALRVHPVDPPGCTLAHLRTVLAAEHLALPARHTAPHRSTRRGRHTARQRSTSPSARARRRHVGHRVHRTAHRSRRAPHAHHSSHHRPASYRDRLRSLLGRALTVTADLHQAARALRDHRNPEPALARGARLLARALRAERRLHPPTEQDAAWQHTIRVALGGDAGAARELRADRADLAHGAALPSLDATLQSVISGLRQITIGLQSVPLRPR